MNRNNKITFIQSEIIERQDGKKNVNVSAGYEHNFQAQKECQQFIQTEIEKK